MEAISVELCRNVFHSQQTRRDDAKTNYISKLSSIAERGVIMNDSSMSQAVAQVMDLMQMDTTHYMARHLKFLVNSDADYYQFVNELSKCQSCFHAVATIRYIKLTKNHLTLSKFLDLYAYNKLTALQTLFQQPLTMVDLAHLHTRMKQIPLTIEQLYDRHMASPEVLMLKLLT
jgi:hypothetical protein